jgi:hypothetical protein
MATVIRKHILSSLLSCNVKNPLKALHGNGYSNIHINKFYHITSKIAYQ